MYELAATLQTAQVIDRILTAAAQAEAAIYRADDWYQSHIVPTVEQVAIAAFIAFVRGAYLTFIAGQDTREWFDAWFARYCLDAVPAVETLLIEEPILMIEAPKTRIAGLLMPVAPTVIELPEKVAEVKPARQRKPKTETKGKPSPKSRKPAGIAPRKKPTLYQGIPID
ncbi:hypothetical protein [Altericista sp. CCNU0014]|uniref:hypothetical protein n=1 Tax=Altericista sp. CCNU0014 TaxID=3082949 RepID=UPI00384BAF69